MIKAAWLKPISVFVPYVAVIIGLYFFKNAWIAIGLYHFGIVLFLIAGDRNAMLKRILRGLDAKMAAASIAIPAMIFPIIFFFWEYMRLENLHLKNVLADVGLHGSSWFFFMIYFSTVQPFLEELYWRDYLDRTHKHFSWTDLAFAGYHILVLGWFIKLPWLAIAFIVLALVSYGWRRVGFKLKGLAVPLLSHIAADVSIVVVTNTLIRY